MGVVHLPLPVGPVFGWANPQLILGRKHLQPADGDALRQESFDDGRGRAKQLGADAVQFPLVKFLA